MKAKVIPFLLFSILLFLGSNGDNLFQNNYVPKDGYVPNEETAVRIAEAIWLPIYGEKDVESCKPFVAKLKNSNIWVVEGTAPPRQKGGVFYIEIRKSDCKILKVIGEK